MNDAAFLEQISLQLDEIMEALKDIIKIMTDRAYKFDSQSKRPVE